MHSPAAIPAAWLTHSKHLQLNPPTLTTVINASIVVVLLCRWAGPRPPVRYWGPWLGCRLPDYTISRYCDTMAYDIVIQFFLTIRALVKTDAYYIAHPYILSKIQQ